MFGYNQGKLVFFFNVLVPDIVKTTKTRKDYENWLRLVVFVNFGGKKLFKEIIYEKEQLPRDGCQLYSKLATHTNKLQYQLHEEILCPSNEIIDESKFDLKIYALVIYLLFGTKYKHLIYEVRDKRNKIFHMADKLICEAKFDKLWNETGDMLRKHGFDIQSLDDLKTCDLASAENLKGISKFFYQFVK